MTLWPHQDRYFNPQAQAGTASYVQLAQDYGIAPELLAHAFVLTRPFVTASIVGGTTIRHLDQAFSALEFDLTEELESKLEALHKEYLVPAP